MTFEKCRTNCDDVSQAAYVITRKVVNNGLTVAPTVVSYYDSMGRIVFEETYIESNPVKVKTEYDAFGRVSRISEPYQLDGEIYWTEFKTYDDRNRPTEIWYPKSEIFFGQPKATISYEARTGGGTKKTVIQTISDASETTTRKTVEEYDAAGFLVRKVENADGTDVVTTRFQYDAYGNISHSMVNENPATVVTRGYNEANNLTSLQDPDIGSITYGYDAFGNLESTNQNGVVTKYKYDVLNRIVSRTDNWISALTPSTANWYYDKQAECDPTQLLNGRLCRETQTGLDIKYQYDSAGRLDNQAWKINGIQNYIVDYAYDPQGRLGQLTYPNDFAVNYVYDSRGLSQVIDGTNSEILYEVQAFDARGGITQEQYGNQFIESRSFDPATGMITGITSANDAGAWQSFAYEWDSLGNLRRRTDSLCGVGDCVSEDVYGYDGLGRLNTHTKTAATGTVSVDDFVYDVLGNLRYMAGSSEYKYDSARPHAVTSIGDKSFGYDAHGNLNLRNGKTVSYTSFNKPESIEMASGGNIKFDYGTDRKRYKKEMPNGDKTYYIGGIYEETVNSGNVVLSQKAFVNSFLQHTTESGTAKYIYLHRDHLGSVSLTSDGGEVVETLSGYSPFGKRTTSAESDYPQNRGFTDHEHLNVDEDGGLIHMNGRVYDPVIGRFLSPDPILQAPYSSQNYNRYSYVMNNPLSFTDPSGYNALALTEILTAWWGSLFAGGVATNQGFDQSFSSGPDQVLADYSLGAGATYVGDNLGGGSTYVGGTTQVDSLGTLTGVSLDGGRQFTEPYFGGGRCGRECYDSRYEGSPIAQTGLTTYDNPSSIVGPSTYLKNSHLENLPIHPNRERFYITAGELSSGNLIQRHPTNDEQRFGSPLVGHGGVRNLSNDELTRFGGPRGTDPISGYREYQAGDSFRFPGSLLNIQGGHHRLEEINRRVGLGLIEPNALIEIRIKYDD
jgi:RHS repeat-associated protein